MLVLWLLWEGLQVIHHPAGEVGPDLEGKASDPVPDGGSGRLPFWRACFEVQSV